MRPSPWTAGPQLVLIWFALSLAAPALVRAEEMPEESTRLPGYRAMKASAGIGFVWADDRNGQAVQGSGEGFYGSAEYVLRASSWFSPRVYAGLIIAPPRSDCGAHVLPCDVAARFLFGGAKARTLVPIPWIAPFLELGFGVSVGQFSTRSGLAVSQATNGIAYHVPFSVGVALGEHRQFELAVQYLDHPAQGQTSGALAFGMQFPLD
jgi:hypothetical protein